MSTTELFNKHFGEKVAVDMKHPHMENFFNDLNDECLQEDKVIDNNNEIIKIQKIV